MAISKILLLAGISVIGLSNISSANAQVMLPGHNAAEVEAKVKEVFAATPEMIAIAQCESKFRQYYDSGLPYRSSNGQYIGVFQISEGHAANAASKGFDIYTVEGNIGFAKYLYNQSGTRPWSGCVGAAPATSAPVASTISTAINPLTITLKTGITHSQVLTLQQLLNKSGFIIAASGPGSPGNETTYFGGLTRAAVQKFQCSHNITCSGNENTTGYGLVGPKTRSALLNLVNP